jgi:4-diphosphocytidyl-2-C-methyl-D-erythritol kinase
LRLLARTNGIALDDPRLLQAARATGADVPVCLDPRPRLMRGIGEILSAPLDLPKLHAVLVNPGVAVPTNMVFAGLNLARTTAASNTSPQWPGNPTDLVAALAKDRNDLEGPAIELQPVIAELLAVLRNLPGCQLARMSGSGATCFGLFDTSSAAADAARMLRVGYPDWWVEPTALS